MVARVAPTRLTIFYFFISIFLFFFLNSSRSLKHLKQLKLDKNILYCQILPKQLKKKINKYSNAVLYVQSATVPDTNNRVFFILAAVKIDKIIASSFIR